MKKTILLVDDVEDIRKITRIILENEGWKVITAENGEDCLKKLKAHKIDLILLDIMMPGLTTHEIVPKIKDTKIIFASSVQMTADEKSRLFEYKNAVDYIAKPFDTNELVLKVRKALGERNGRQ